ncbi:LysR family transcriptional regulator [Balneatrix alpica]|uniref:LysR family transcriptional regulator n=1 Tax=Balneatrix alpica TaxID=75684 RepID=A0ABV5Z9E8_9GAMM|nr:LysR family transcriptional regulator [Balneatrix alpica]
MPDLNDILVFTKVVEMQSFTAAAERLGLTKATVSRKLADLEERLGARLLNRTTRQLSLTEVGEVFYERCSRIMADIDDAQALVTTRSEQVKGKLKVVMPIEFGQLLMGRFLGHFIQKFPEVELDVELTNRRLDMVQEGIDVSIQLGMGQDSNLIARRLGSSRKVLVAAPAYLQRCQVPDRPEQLAEHEIIMMKVFGETLSHWHFSRGGQRVSIQPRGRLQCNNITFAREALVSGLGIGHLPLFMALPYLNEGRLVRVLEDWQMDSAELYALYQSRQYMPKLLKTFLDEVSLLMQRVDELDTGCMIEPEHMIDRLMAQHLQEDISGEEQSAKLYTPS